MADDNGERECDAYGYCVWVLFLRAEGGTGISRVVLHFVAGVLRRWCSEAADVGGFGMSIGPSVRSEGLPCCILNSFPVYNDLLI